MRWCAATPRSSSRMLKGMPDEMKVWASHGDFVAAAPPGFAVAATSNNAPVAVMEAPERGYYALLFHPEVAHTDRGKELLRNFAFDVCGCTGDWTIASFIDEATARIRAQVGDGRVVCGAVGRRRFDGRRFADPPRHRRSAAVHLRRQRPAAPERSAAGRRALQEAAAAGASRRCDRHVPRRGSPASPIPNRSARSSAGRSSTSSTTRPRELGRLRFPRAGHALSGRDRIGLGARAVGDDQEPSQRRRAAGGHELQAGRAAARAVQGRSARRRAATSASTRSSWSASRSRARAWRCASSARITRDTARRCCAGRRDRRRGDAQGRAGTSASGKASRCCCRCRASA